MIRPQPATTAHPAWLAALSPSRIEPCTCATATVPISATPSDWPTCRLVEATAAATPDCERGIPETAVLVIGAFTTPKPSPNSA